MEAIKFGGDAVLGLMDQGVVVHRGSYHCQAVKVELDAPQNPEVELCDCDVCSMTTGSHVFAPASRFRVVEGELLLRRCVFGTHQDYHFFCQRCGVHVFYVPMHAPDLVAVASAVIGL